MKYVGKEKKEKKEKKKKWNPKPKPKKNWTPAFLATQVIGHYFTTSK